MNHKLICVSVIALFCATTLADWPPRGEICYMNVPHVANNPARWRGVDLVTDVHARIADSSFDSDTPEADFRAVVDRFREAGVSNIGCYVSGNHVANRASLRQWPNDCVVRETLLTTDYGPDLGDWYKGPVYDGAARERFEWQIRARSVWLRGQYGVNVVFRDNHTHPSVDRDRYADPNLPNTFAQEMANIRGTRLWLNERGIRQIINLAVDPAYLSADDVHALASAADGVSLEMCLHPSTRSDPTRMARLRTTYWRMLDAGLVVIMVPVRIGPDATEFRSNPEFARQVVIPFANETRRDGDTLLVTWDWFRALPETSQ